MHKKSPWYAPRVWLVVVQYACKSHSTKHPNIPSDFPVLSHSLLTRWWWLHRSPVNLEGMEKWLKKQTFSLKIQPVGSLYWGASWEAYRLPKTQRGPLERKALIDGFGGIEWWLTVASWVGSFGAGYHEADYLFRHGMFKISVASFKNTCIPCWFHPMIFRSMIQQEFLITAFYPRSFEHWIE